MQVSMGKGIVVAAFVMPAWATGLSAQEPVGFLNAARQVGIAFEHENGATLEKHLPETMGSGVVIWDYDADGWSDVFLVNGGSFVDPEVAARTRSRLYRNRGDGTFEDATEASGIDGSEYGMGACAADYDNDGWTDLYVTSVTTNRLYRNDGDGSFTDVTAAAGVASSLWSASCAFGDVDRDGHVDLYVTNYVDWAPDNNRHCTEAGIPVYCHPNVYNGLTDVLYRNNGDGTFESVGAEVGLGAADGNGLGVVFADLDVDGRPDIYVANDSVPNFMFHNEGGGIFRESGLWAGVAVGNTGQPQAGMGTDIADIDGDGLPDAFVTNLAKETHSLYRNVGSGMFADATFESGLARATLPYVGFGTAFLDFDNDGDLDLAIANGDVIDNVELYRDDTTHAQPNLLLANDGTGRFTDLSARAGPGFALLKVSRGLAVGDFDNDGDLDIIVTNNGQTADVLVNDGGNRNNALLIRTVGTLSNRSGIGARVSLTLADKTLVRVVKAGSSYLSQNDLRLHFGMGTAAAAERIEIAWPSGTVEVITDVWANQILTVVEGEGITESRPFAGRPER